MGFKLKEGKNNTANAAFRKTEVKTPESKHNSNRQLGDERMKTKALVIK